MPPYAQLRAYATIDAARKWRQKFKRGDNFKCFYHPDHPKKVSVKNSGPKWIEGTVIMGYVMLGISLCPIVMFLLYLMWTMCISDCIHEIEEVSA